MIRFLALLLFSLPVFGQAWSGIVAPSRAINWANAGAGTIPARTTICATLNPGATAAQINSAISSCTTDGVVFLNAGTYTLTGVINIVGKNNVTLRGAGPDLTLLRISNASSSCGTYPALIQMCGVVGWRPLGGSGQTTATWSSTSGVSGTYAQGATSIYLSSKANLVVGSVIVLYQNEDTTDQWPEVYQCATNCSTEGAAFGVGYLQGQTVTVTSVQSGTCSPCLIGIAQPIYHANWRTAMAPRAYWESSVGSNQGVENLSVENMDAVSSIGSIIAMSNIRNGWIKNVRTINANRNHIGIYGSTQVTVRDSYTYGLKGSAAVAYGIEPVYSSAFLLENNIHHKHQAAILTTQGASGGVIAYNYQIASNYCTLPSWMNASGWHHSAGSDYILWEGNDFNGYTADAIHGSSHFATLFRNRLNGYDPYQCGSTASTMQTVPAHIYAYARYANVVGNVLGDDRAGHNVYESYAVTTSSSAQAANQSIFVLGFSGDQAQWTSPVVPNDVRVRESLFRWGNWDTVADAPRWNVADVPTALTKYANTVPASQTLPSSFYLSAKPSWFGSIAWPAIGPDITSGRANTAPLNTGAEGKFYKIPARVCFETVMGGTGTDITAKTFNANSCYSSTVVRPNAPTNVVVTFNDRMH